MKDIGEIEKRVQNVEYYRGCAGIYCNWLAGHSKNSNAAKIVSGDEFLHFLIQVMEYKFLNCESHFFVITL